MQTRERKILELTDLVYASLDLEYVRTTGSLFASKSLRHSATRQQMSFMKNFEYEGRLLTEKVTTRVVKNLLDSKSLEIPTCTPGYSKRKWVKDSAQLLLSLLQKARRSYSAMGTMDTQPWQLDETEDSVNRCHAARIYISRKYHACPYPGRTGDQAGGLEYFHCGLHEFLRCLLNLASSFAHASCMHDSISCLSWARFSRASGLRPGLLCLHSKWILRLPIILIECRGFPGRGGIDID